MLRSELWTAKDVLASFSIESKISFWYSEDFEKRRKSLDLVLHFLWERKS